MSSGASSYFIGIWLSSRPKTRPDLPIFFVRLAARLLWQLDGVVSMATTGVVSTATSGRGRDGLGEGFHGDKEGRFPWQRERRDRADAGSERHRFR